MTLLVQMALWALAYLIFHAVTDGLTWQGRAAVALCAGLLVYAVKVIG